MIQIKFRICRKMFATLRIKSVLLLGFALFIQNINSKSVEKFENCDAKLIFVHTICRHGARNVDFCYPKDPWSSEKFWPGGFGQLTNEGKLQLFELGKYLRKRYETLLQDSTHPVNKVYVESTEKDRVLTSAALCLAGLFPPIGDEVWNDDLLWQPIPVHYTPATQNIVLEPEKACDRYDALLESFEQNLLDEFMRNHESVFKYLEANSGKKLTSMYAFQKLYDTLTIEQSRGLSLQYWAEQVLRPDSDFHGMALKRFPMFTATTDMKKIKCGFLLKEILDRFSNKTNLMLSPNRSLWMYFGHETTIVNMLNTLGTYEPHQPPYASCLFFELYQCDGELYVQIVYKNSTTNPLEIPPLDIPNCGTKCPLSKLYELYDEILPKHSHDEECKL